MFNLPSTFFGSPINPYVANAVDYNALTNYLNRGAGLTGAVDGSQGIFYCYFRLDGTDGTTVAIFRNSSATVNVLRFSDNKIKIQVLNSAMSLALTLNSTTTYSSGATWHSLLAAWD